MQNIYDKKLDIKVQKLLACCMSKTKSHLALQGVRAERDTLIATDGRQMVVVKTKHYLMEGFVYAIKANKIGTEVITGHFPNWKRVFDEYHSKLEMPTEVHSKDNLGLTLMRYCIDRVLYCNLVRYHQTINALNSLNLNNVNGVTFNHVNPAKHPQGLLWLTITTGDVAIDYLLTTTSD